MKYLMCVGCDESLNDIFRLLCDDLGFAFATADTWDEITSILSNCGLPLAVLSDYSTTTNVNELIKLFNQECLSTKVILLTSGSKSYEDALKLGAYGVLNMPFDWEEFMALIKL